MQVLSITWLSPAPTAVTAPRLLRRVTLSNTQWTRLARAMRFASLLAATLMCPCGQVFFVEEADALDLASKGEDDGMGEGDDAVFLAFAVAQSDGLVVKVDFFDAQAMAFHQPRSGAVEEFGHEFVYAGHLVEEAHHLSAGEDGGEALGAFGLG